MSRGRVSIQWTETARECLRKLPYKVRKGLLDKADELLGCDDPREAHKPLTGPLQGYYRITYSRYRAIYSVDEEKLANGQVRVTLLVRFVAAGVRKDGDKNDIYRLAEKLVKLGLIQAKVTPRRLSKKNTK